MATSCRGKSKEGAVAASSEGNPDDAPFFPRLQIRDDRCRRRGDPLRHGRQRAAAPAGSRRAAITHHVAALEPPARATSHARHPRSARLWPQRQARARRLLKAAHGRGPRRGDGRARPRPLRYRRARSRRSRVAPPRQGLAGADRSRSDPRYRAHRLYLREPDAAGDRQPVELGDVGRARARTGDDPRSGGAAQAHAPLGRSRACGAGGLSRDQRQFREPARDVRGLSRRRVDRHRG